MQAIRILENVYGEDHLEVAEVLNSMGIMLKKKAKYAEAQPLYERALRIVQKTFQGLHPKIGMYLNNLADLERKRGNLFAAYTSYLKSKKILEETLGVNHPEVADVWNNLGLIQKKQQQYADAHECFSRALDIVTDQFGPKHFKTALFGGNLAHLLLLQGDIEGATKQVAVAINGVVEALGIDHIETADLFMLYIDLLEATHQSDAISKIYLVCSFAYYKAFDMNHPKWLNIVAKLTAETQRNFQACRDAAMEFIGVMAKEAQYEPYVAALKRLVRTPEEIEADEEAARVAAEHVSSHNETTPATSTTTSASQVSREKDYTPALNALKRLEAQLADKPERYCEILGLVLDNLKGRLDKQTCLSRLSPLLPTDAKHDLDFALL